MSVEKREKHPGRTTGDSRWISEGNRVSGDPRYLAYLHVSIGEELQFALTESGTVFARGKWSMVSIADEEVIATAATVIDEDMSFVLPEELMRSFDAQPRDHFRLSYRDDHRISVLIDQAGYTPKIAREIEAGRVAWLRTLQEMTPLEEMEGVAAVVAFGLPSYYPTRAQIQKQIESYSKPETLPLQRHPRIIPTLAAWTGKREAESPPIELEVSQPEPIETGNLTQGTLFDVPITGKGVKIPKRR